MTFKPKSSEYAPVKKNLPYTISAIGGPADLERWKIEQKRLQDVWNAGKLQRYAQKKEKAINILQGIETPTIDKNTVIEAKYHVDQAKQLERYRRTLVAPSLPSSTSIENKISLKDRILNFLLNIKF